MWSLDSSLKSCPGIKLLLNPPYFLFWHQGTLILFCCSSPLLFIEVQVQKRLRSMSQSIIISRVVLDPLRLSFTLGHPFQIQFSGELWLDPRRAGGREAGCQHLFLSVTALCIFFLSVYIYHLVPQKSKRQPSFKLIRAPRVNEPLPLCPQEINKSFNHSEIGKVSAC